MNADTQRRVLTHVRSVLLVLGGALGLGLAGMDPAAAAGVAAITVASVDGSSWWRRHLARRATQELQDR